MLQQGAWTFRYGLEGFLKRTLFVADGPRSESELIEAVLSGWAGQDEVSSETIPDRVRASLRARNGSFREAAEGAFALRDASGEDLQERAYRFLQESGRPQKHGEILRHLQQVTGRGRGELMSRLDLDTDPRFVRLEGGEWLLTEWELVNDAVADLMVELGQRQAKREDLLALLDDAQVKISIFQPELDPRFTVAGDDVVECLLLESEAAPAAVEVAAGTALEEEHMGVGEQEQALMERTDTETEESAMNATATEITTNETAKVTVAELVSTVLAQLSQAADQLNQRNQELPNEVLSLFNLEDLQGIESLMRDRKRIEAMAADVNALVTKWKEDASF